MRHLLLAVFLAVTLPASAERLKVVELFTSEGCSSCPPADAVLSELARQPDVLALSMHVDYWDRLGWTDPYSLPAFSKRQRQYASVLSGKVYTPEMVINGKIEVVGSQKSKVLAAVKDAPAASLEPELKIRRDGGRVKATYAVSSGREVTCHLLVVDSQRRSKVARGENSGRMLDHTNVVRQMLSSAKKQGSVDLDLPSDFSTGMVVLLVQDSKSLSILGASRVAL